MMIEMLVMLAGVTPMVASVLWIIWRQRKKNKFSPFTEPMLRPPGHSLSKRLTALETKASLPLLALLIFPMTFGIAYQKISPIAATILGLIIAAIVIASIIRLGRVFLQSLRVKLGLMGEIYTGQELNYLMRRGAWVYHDIPFKYGNIDHVVISKGGIFVVETKAVRKPMSKKGRKLAKVGVLPDRLVFPHSTTQKPIIQAKQQAKYLKTYLSTKLGVSCPVYPVIAIPGWYIEADDQKKGFLVINPKRGKALRKYVSGRARISPQNLKNVVLLIEDIARSVEFQTDITDPDAKTKYSFFLNKKEQERKI